MFELLHGSGTVVKEVVLEAITTLVVEEAKVVVVVVVTGMFSFHRWRPDPSSSFSRPIDVPSWLVLNNVLVVLTPP